MSHGEGCFGRRWWGIEDGSGERGVEGGSRERVGGEEFGCYSCVCVSEGVRRREMKRGKDRGGWCINARREGRWEKVDFKRRERGSGLSRLLQERVLLGVDCLAYC